MPIKKEIVYPVFLECCQYTEDIFWENIFNDLAYGKPPYGTYINKNFLCCSYKKKEFSYKIENKEPKILYQEIYKLLKNKVGILSHLEKSKKRIDFINLEKEINEYRTSWNKIRKKNIKDILIEQYVVRMKKKYLLSVHQSRKLLSTLFIAMVLKVFTSNDIVYKDGNIEKINGIEFKKKEIIYTKELYDFEISLSPQIIVEKRLISDSWEKYLKELQKMNK